MKTGNVTNLNDINRYEIFPWNKNFDTGIALIDEQHKKLVQLLNQLASHLAYQADNLTLNEIFSELADYASYHFQAEEKIWHEFLAGEVFEQEHKALHHEFVMEIHNLKKHTDSPEHVIEEILSFLTHWLAFHILDCDKRMAKTVLAIQEGMSMQQAKEYSEREMGGAMKLLAESILFMYDNLSARTLHLMREIIAKQKIEAKQRLAASVFENTLDAICIMDVDFNIVDANPAFYQSSQYSDEEVIGKHLKTLKSGLEDNNINNLIWQILDNQGHWNGKVTSHNKRGEVCTEWLTLSCVKDNQGRISNYVGVFSDISYFIQQQDNLEHIAHHDMLTKLPNRLLLFNRLEVAMAQAEHCRTMLAICYLDLDGFKPINDNYGHIAGDYVLQTIAKRLSKNIRNNDTVARLGGDEFVILLGDIERTADCESLLNRIINEIAEPIQITDTVVKVSASIGIALFPRDGDDTKTLIEHADQAMYQAKKSGKSTYCWYA